MKKQREYSEISYVGINLQPTSICTGVELTTTRRAISKLLNSRLKQTIDENSGQVFSEVEALERVMNILNDEIGA